MAIRLTKEQRRRGQELHRKAIVINGLSFYNLLKEADTKHFSRYCDIMAKGGVSAVNCTVAYDHSLNETCRRIANVLNDVYSASEQKVVIPMAAEEIRRAKVHGQAAIILGFQNTAPLEGNLKLLTFFHRIGVRIIQLTYSWRALTGDGCYERTDGGLTRFGIDVIEEVNRLGILLDLSHCGRKTTLEAIETSRDPVAFTHSAARALNNFERNKTDEEIKALAEKGGVMGIIAESNFLRHEGGLKEKKNQYYEYIYAKGFDTMAKSLNVTKGLLGRGYSDQEITKILGGNFLRLFEKVWRK